MRVLIGIGVSLLVCWIVLIVALAVTARARPEVKVWTEATRLLPDVIVLVKRLATDAAVGRVSRMRLALLLGYLLLPFDLIPDFLPVIGFADDAIVIALVLRAVVRTSGSEVVRRNWPGTEVGYDVIQRLCGISSR